MPRWPTAECSGLLHYLRCFLCYLAAPICIEDRASNSLPGTPLQALSSFYLLRSSVQILWMLTDFWSLIVTPVDTDQLSNAPLFDKSHYCGSNQENQNLKNLKTVSIYQNVSKNTALTNFYSLSSENQFHVLLSPQTHQSFTAYSISHVTAIHEEM